MCSWPAKTWASGVVATKDDFNEFVRDPLTDLDQHQHTGADGDGDTVLGSLDREDFADQAASPSAAGELQRNGVNLEWYGAAVVAITEADAVAGTASPRTLGTGAQQAAVGSHTHDPTDVGTSQDASDSEVASSNTIASLTSMTLTVSEQILKTIARTPGSANRSLVIAATTLQHIAQPVSAQNHSWQFRLYVDAVQRVNKSIADRAGDATNSKVYQDFAVYVEVNPSVASHTMTVKVLHNNDQTNVPVLVHAGSSLIVEEVKVS